MKKFFRYGGEYIKILYSRKIIKVMRNTILLLLLGVFNLYAFDSYAQNTRLSLDLSNIPVKRVLEKIEENSEFYFLFNAKLIDVDREVSISVENEKISDILASLFKGTGIEYILYDRQIILSPTEFSRSEAPLLQLSVSGKITDIATGDPMPGVNIQVKGTSLGTISDAAGRYSLSVPDRNAILIFSFIGYITQEIALNGQNTLNVVLSSDISQLEEVVVIGYGTMKKSDLTGAVLRADIEVVADQPNVSVVQKLQGTVPGLNVSQVQKAGEDPVFTIRGRTSISGEQTPLIILDEVIYRGSLIDINPADIQSIDVLKDNSAAAVYGSQAANGVIIITTKTGQGQNKRPSINYTASFGIHQPTKEFRPGSPEDFIQKNIALDFYNSRTAASGYLEPVANYDPTYRFKTNLQAENYRNGLSTDWYDLLTNDNIFIQSHNLSLTSKTENINYFISVGAISDEGYMLNEDYQRYNARINVDNKITDWLNIGVQSFFSLSDNSGLDVFPSGRYLTPFAVAYDENGKMITRPGDYNANPLLEAYAADDLDLRTNFFGNIYAKISIPFIKGLSYRINLHDNYTAVRNYTFKDFSNNYQGSGSKVYSNLNDMSSDNTLTYKRTFNNNHDLDITLLYGFELRKFDNTNSTASIFISPILGYNSLQSGSSDALSIITGAWKEASLYSMARLFYSYRNRYMITGTVRRDGFSGFSEKNKFGFFPSVALGWVPTEESFFPDFLDVLNYLKIRLSYGSTGNRTIGRYQTLARVSGGNKYVNENGESMYGQSISSMSSSDLKWETTTGVNLGIDFGLLKSRISGSVEYYNNNTTDILYNVDIPSIGRFTKFPDNLGKLHNHGIELSLSSTNISAKGFSWSTNLVFSRNRDELVELLGFDNDGDGKEDDLISEGLFIGKPLNINYAFEITGEFYQLGDEIPAGSAAGAYKIVDQNNDGMYNQSDYKILNYKDPSYRFGFSNRFQYKNLSLNIFINSIQGGKDYYFARDDLANQSDDVNGFSVPNDEHHFSNNFPKGLDYWLPENPNARYQNIDMKISYYGSRYTQRSFVRLQDISLSYSFNTTLLNKLKMNRFRVFLSGKNLATWTKWPGWDPETGIAIGMAGRPVLRSYTVGLDVEF